MALLFCTRVDPGLRPAEVTVTVEEYDGRPQYFPIDRGMLTTCDGKIYLSVGIIHEDPSRQVALISLPEEADSGANRLWVNLDQIR
jgi:hypothetical protein